MNHQMMLADLVKTARNRANLTQSELAARTQTKQPAIARAESEGIGSLSFAERLINACGYELKFHHVSLCDETGSITPFYGSK